MKILNFILKRASEWNENKLPDRSEAARVSLGKKRRKERIGFEIAEFRFTCDYCIP